MDAVFENLCSAPPPSWELIDGDQSAGRQISHHLTAAVAFSLLSDSEMGSGRVNVLPTSRCKSVLSWLKARIECRHHGMFTFLYQQ